MNKNMLVIILCNSITGVAKLVDASELDSGAEKYASSNLASRIFNF